MTIIKTEGFGSSEKVCLCVLNWSFDFSLKLHLFFPKPYVDHDKHSVKENFRKKSLPDSFLKRRFALGRPSVTESIEIMNVFIWNDLLLTAKTSNECTLNHFWQVSRFFYSVYYRPNFYFYWLTLLSKSTHMKRTSSVYLLCKGDWVIRDKCLYSNQSGIGCKKFQWVHPKTFLTSLQFFKSVYYGQTFTSACQPFCPNWIMWTVLPL